MARVETGSIQIVDCSHGLSDWYPTRLAENQLAEAVNVEFWDGAVCGRRPGVTVKVTNPGVAQQASIFVHTPTVNAADNKLWRADGHATASNFWFWDLAYAQTNVTQAPNDSMLCRLGVDWVSLHGKLYIAAKSSVNRLHVYDGTTLRRVGIAPVAAAPSVVSTGSGAFSGLRGYRVRFIVSSGTFVFLRSEPSPANFFTPPGTGSGALITRPAGPGEGETHWELEEASPNGFWYRIATIALATTTYTDTLATSAIATSGVQAEDIGDYTTPPSAQWLTVDEDRLLMGGNWEDAKQSARVSWTPLGSQTGNGNDERIALDQGSSLDFDTLDGGGLTGIKAWEGKVIVFKRGQVHQMIRSGAATRAYMPDCLSRRHGAIPHSIVEGTDVDGLSCLYFLDPDVGPMQLGVRGLRVLCPQMQRTWKARINLLAQQPASVTYHPDKRQVWWHLALDGEQVPWIRWCYSVESDGLVYHTLAQPIRSAARFNGKPHMLVDVVNPNAALLLQADDYTSASDYGVPYRAYVRTKAYQFGQMIRRFQIDSMILEAQPLPATDIAVTCVRDFGLEVRTVTVPLAGTEDFVVLPVDNAYLTEALAIQFEIGDPVARVVGPWQVHGVTATYSLGSPSTGRG